MKRAALYSSTNKDRIERERTASGRDASPAPSLDAAAAGPSGLRARAGALMRRHERLFMFAAGLLIALAVVFGRDAMRPAPQDLTQEDIDAAVMNTLLEKTLPSRQAKAAELVRQSVVRVRSMGVDPKKPKEGEQERGVGSGVVIVDDGTILTNLHVVWGAEKIMVTFFDGSEAEAVMVGAQPENDLAVIKAKKIPDDLPSATLGSSASLKPGDEVVAVGFPFGIGPSVSAGVVSGLNREFRSPEGKRQLTRLIQFDAAANPGNSGGPLVTMGGEVVGIVTAILNPTEARTFIGIGFAATIESAGSAVGIPPF